MDSPCYTGVLVARRDAGAAPPWDRIVQPRYRDAVHSCDTALPGWPAPVARRHVSAP